MGAGAFFVGSAMMPTIFVRLAKSRVLYALPAGRLKLLFGALLTTAIVSVPLPMMSVLVSRAMFSSVVANPDLSTLQAISRFLKYPILWNLVVNVFLFCTFMYVVLWFLTTSRTVLGKTFTMLVAVVLLVVPPKFTSLNPSAPIAQLVVGIAGAWLVFAGVFLCGPRWRRRVGDSVTKLFRSVLRLPIGPKNVCGKETELLLGVANRWLLALATCLCIGLYSMFLPATGPWLFFLAILAIVGSGISIFAVVRSRALWLRQSWSRIELFDRIESFLWRQNAISMFVLTSWFVGIGSYAHIDGARLALGIPLIPLSVAASLYLGMMQTRGLHWLDGLLAIVTTLLIMSIAIVATERDIELPVVVGLEVLLAIAVPVSRPLAKQRWTEIDWLQTRSLLASS